MLDKKTIIRIDSEIFSAKFVLVGNLVDLKKALIENIKRCKIAYKQFKPFKEKLDNARLELKIVEKQIEFLEHEHFLAGDSPG